MDILGFSPQACLEGLFCYKFSKKEEGTTYFICLHPVAFGEPICSISFEEDERSAVGRSLIGKA